MSQSVYFAYLLSYCYWSSLFDVFAPSYFLITNMFFSVI